MPYEPDPVTGGHGSQHRNAKRPAAESQRKIVNASYYAGGSTVGYRHYRGRPIREVAREVEARLRDEHSELYEGGFLSSAANFLMRCGYTLTRDGVITEARSRRDYARARIEGRRPEPRKLP